MSEAQFVACPWCDRRRPWRGRTDGFGGVIDETPPCTCPEGRRKAGICRDCHERVEGMVGRALRCARHKKEAKRRQEREYYRRHRKKRLARDKERRRRPEVRVRRRLARRRRRESDPETYSRKKRECNRRYALRHPDRVIEQMERQNAREDRKEARRRWAHEKQTVYAGTGKVPTCECGAEVPWSGTGRPMKKCEECDPERWRQARRRWAKRVRDGLAPDEVPPELREVAA